MCSGTVNLRCGDRARVLISIPTYKSYRWTRCFSRGTREIPCLPARVTIKKGVELRVRMKGGGGDPPAVQGGAMHACMQTGPIGTQSAPPPLTPSGGTVGRCDVDGRWTCSSGQLGGLRAKRGRAGVAIQYRSRAHKARCSRFWEQRRARDAFHCRGRCAQNASVHPGDEIKPGYQGYNAISRVLVDHTMFYQNWASKRRRSGDRLEVKTGCVSEPYQALQHRHCLTCDRRLASSLSLSRVDPPPTPIYLL